MIDRLARVAFAIELALLAVPALVAFLSSLSMFSELADIVARPQAEGSRGLGLAGLCAYTLYGFTLSAFCLLAVRYLIGGGPGVARVTPIVWGLALLGQAVVAPAVVLASVSEFAPNWVRVIALLTFPALGLFIPLVHLLAAAAIARRSQDRPSPA